MRGLSDKFIEDLKKGILSPLTDAVKSDTSLCLELRGSYVNLYYRGCNLMKVATIENADTYVVEFDKNYLKTVGLDGVPAKDDIHQWLNFSPTLKKAIDRYLATEKNKDERECQQRILRDNNYSSIARSTDYYICDIEYQNQQGRFDMIGVEWPSESAARQRQQGWRLVFIEVKHGDNALGGRSGLHSHIRHVNKFVGSDDNLHNIKRDMVDVFNQKLELGLIDCGKPLKGFSDKKPLLLLALVNHDPGSSKLGKLLKGLPDSQNVEICICTASFLGYGLYKQGIHSVNDAQRRFWLVYRLKSNG